MFPDITPLLGLAVFGAISAVICLIGAVAGLVWLATHVQIVF